MEVHRVIFFGCTYETFSVDVEGKASEDDFAYVSDIWDVVSYNQGGSANCAKINYLKNNV